MSALKTEFIRKNQALLLGDEPPPHGEEPSLLLLPSDVKKIVNEIREIEFSPSLGRWIEDYEKVGQRGRFLWQWCLKGLGLTTLPCVEPALRQHIIETKMLSIFYGTLIDDIADREQDREMLQMAISAASDNWFAERLALWTDRRRDYLEMIYKLWQELWSRCQSYPRFSEFEFLLRFDNE